MGNSYRLLRVGLLLGASHSISDVTLHSSLQDRRLIASSPFLSILDTNYMKRGAVACRCVTEFLQSMSMLFVTARQSII